MREIKKENERESERIKKNNKIFTIYAHIVLKLKLYYSSMLKFLTFRTFDVWKAF